MDQELPLARRPSGAVLSKPSRRKSPAVHLQEAGCPEALVELLSELRVVEVQAELKHKYILRTWVRFKRKELAEAELAVPEPEFMREGVYRLRLAVAGEHANQLKLCLPAKEREHFVGFGERFGGVDQRGKKLEVWTEEGAIGFGEFLSPLLTKLHARFNPFPKGPTTAYKPMPWLLSSRGYGIYIATTYPVFFDVGAADAEWVTASIASRQTEVYFFTAPTPKAIVERFVLHLGLPKPLPDWGVGPWNDAVGGSAQVQQTAALLRQAKIPSSAIWTEDWAGGHWSRGGGLAPGWYDINPVRRRTDRRLYPELEKLAGELHGSGYKFLGYYYPFIPIDDPDFAFLAEHGYLLRDIKGEPLVFPFFTGQCGQIDLTNPAAKAWHAGELRHGLALGFDGWMADFGEYTPPDGVTFSGQTGLEHHNAFPLLWAKHNREVLTQARPDNDFVFLSRSGGAGQQAQSAISWSGDSNTDLERWDGLPSNLSAALSAAWSGIADWTTDLGGYMSLLTKGRDEETLARWTEFAALLPVMRTHHGTHPKKSVQFDHSPATLEHYRTYARLHTALFPLLRVLLDQASRDGTPVIRPLAFQFPKDPRCWHVEDAYLLGPDLLVAPVVARAATVRTVYLPAGQDWVDVWTGDLHAGGRELCVHAPIGQIPLFLRNGGYLVVFDTYFDTLVPRRQVTNPEVLAYENGDASLSLLLTPDFHGGGQLHDGGTFTVERRRHGAICMDNAEVRPNELLPGKIDAAWPKIGCASGQDGGIALSSWPGSPQLVLVVRGASRVRRWTVLQTLL